MWQGFYSLTVQTDKSLKTNFHRSHGTIYCKDRDNGYSLTGIKKNNFPQNFR